MNFKKKPQDYPKAFKLLNETLVNYSNPRDLYDFFDQNNLNIRIAPEMQLEGINWCWIIYWTKNEKNHIYPSGNFFDFAQCTDIHGQNGEYPTRSLAEQSAFIKAFELLDKRLNGIDIDKLTT